jgi:hypothetical protein
MRRRLRRRGLGYGWWKLARLDFGLKPNSLMASVTERLVLRVPAAAKADDRTASQAKRASLHIANRNLTLDSK